MPLAKLQRFGEGRRSVEDRFIYDFSWPEEVGRAAVARPGFDDSLRLQPGVGDWLIRLAPLIRLNKIFLECVEDPGNSN